MEGERESSEDNAQRARRLVEGVWNEGTFEVISDLVAPEYANHVPGMPSVEGPEGYEREWRMIRTAFPDIDHVIHDSIVGDETVVFRWSATGTHEGDCSGIEPTGREMHLQGIEIYRFENGKLIESWATVDLLGLLQQLGVLPDRSTG